MVCSCTIEKFSAWECQIQTLVRSYVCLFKAGLISSLHELAASGSFVQKWIIWCISPHIVCFCFPVSNKLSYLFYKCVLAFPLVMYDKSFKLEDVVCDTVRIWKIYKCLHNLDESYLIVPCCMFTNVTKWWGSVASSNSMKKMRSFWPSLLGWLQCHKYYHVVLFDPIYKS